MTGLCSAPLVLRLRLKLGRRLGLGRELCWVLAGELGRVLGGVLQRGGGGRVLRGVAGGRQPPATLPPPGRGRHWDAGRRARARVPRPRPRRGPRHLAHAGGLLGQRGRGRGGCPGRHGGRGRQGAARHGVAGGGGGLLPGEGAGPRGGGARLAAQLPLGPPGGARRRHGTAAWHLHFGRAVPFIPESAQRLSKMTRTFRMFMIHFIASSTETLVHALRADHNRVDVATQVALATDGGGDRGGNISKLWWTNLLIIGLQNSASPVLKPVHFLI